MPDIKYIIFHIRHYENKKNIVKNLNVLVFSDFKLTCFYKKISRLMILNICRDD